jgi:geranylgeranyl reductase family protein
MRRDTDVAIVGAGPSGCAAAITLGHLGYRVALIDRAAFPRDKPCGDYCDPGAVDTLGALGCLPAVLRAGASPIGGMRIVAQDGTAVHPPFPTGRGLLVRRMALDVELVRAAGRAGVDVIERTAVRDVHADGGSVRVETNHSVLTAAIAIACDGMHSAIGRRHGLLRALPPRRYTVGAYFSGVEGSARGELHLGEDRYCGVAQFGGGLANVCMALPKTALRRRSAHRAFTEALRSFPELADRLSTARREGGYRTSGPIGFRSNRVVADRLILAGDASAQVDPMTGQGIFFALRSGMLAAETAAGALASGDATAGGLAGYVRRRRDAFGRTLRTARVLQALALRPHLTPWLMRRLRAHPSLARDLIGVTGDVLPARVILNPRYVLQLLVGREG